MIKRSCVIIEKEFLQVYSFQMLESDRNLQQTYCQSRMPFHCAKMINAEAAALVDAEEFPIWINNCKEAFQRMSCLVYAKFLLVLFETRHNKCSYNYRKTKKWGILLVNDYKSLKCTFYEPTFNRNKIKHVVSVLS